MTGVPVDGPRYPVARSALHLRLLTWRDDTAYGVVAYSNGRTGDGGCCPGDVGVERVELVKLLPGATEPTTVLTAPAKMEDMTVATDHIDTYRPTGPPEYGLNEREIVGRTLTILMCLAPFVAPLLIVWFVRRRRRAAPAR
jgi:hypothetical protein